MKLQFTALAILFSVSISLSQASQSVASTTGTALQGGVNQEFAPVPADHGSLVTMKMAQGSLKYLKKSDFELGEGNSLHLGTGEVLLACRLPTKLSLGEYSLDIGANTVVMITNENSTVIVRNLKEHDENSVTLTDHQSGRAFIRSGREFLIGVSREMLDDLSDKQAMGLRLEPLLGSVVSKITSMVALNSSPLLSTVCRSKDKDDQAVSKTVTTQVAHLDNSETNYKLYTH